MSHLGATREPQYLPNFNLFLHIDIPNRRLLKKRRLITNSVRHVASFKNPGGRGGQQIFYLHFQMISFFLFVLQFSKKFHVWQLNSFQRFSDAFHYFSNAEAERTRISSKTLHTSLKRFLNEIFIRWFHEFSVTMNLQFFLKN